jgi:hypothetical protein
MGEEASVVHKLRKVALLGAFEIDGETDPPLRDGLILGSRRERKGFVLETSRENVEQIVTLSAPARPDLPLRLTITVGKVLEQLGHELVRIELIPLAALAPAPVPAPEIEEAKPKETPEAETEEGQGYFVQGWLVFRNGGRKLHRLPMTATESIQVAITEGLPIMAAYELLQLNVAQLFEEIDAFSHYQFKETEKFHSFVNNVKASDFTRFYEGRSQSPPPGEDEDSLE